MRLRRRDRDPVIETPEHWDDESWYVDELDAEDLPSLDGRRTADGDGLQTPVTTRNPDDQAGEPDFSPFPLPADAPELANCGACGREDRASLMYHAGNLNLYCMDKAACGARIIFNLEAAKTADADAEAAKTEALS